MEKKEAVKDIFNNIAPKYDFLNHLLSLNIDKIWRKKAIKNIGEYEKKYLLDVACGTGDFAIAASKAGIKKIKGIDISSKMVEIGNEKINRLKLANKINLQEGDSEDMIFENNTFNIVTVAFGVRNFENLSLGLKEMQRVLKNDGKVIILEFSMPNTFPIKQLYKFYFRHILPSIGGFFSGSKEAYTYLPQSVLKFPQGEDFLAIMRDCGFDKCVQQKLSFGIASIYVGQKLV